MKAPEPIQRVQPKTPVARVAKQKTKAPLAQPSHQNANVQTLQPAVKKPEETTHETLVNKLVNHNGIPAVHGSGLPVHVQGATLMHQKLQDSLAQTGDLSHPETQKVEKGYKMTLQKDELRDYVNIQSGAYKPKSQEENTILAQAAQSKEVAATQVKEPAKVEQNTTATQQPVAVTADASGAAQEVAAKATPSATANPDFIALQEHISATAKGQQKHEPAHKATDEAQAAAPSPANERQSMAQASQVDTMDAQKPGTFNKEDFKAQLKEKIAGIKLPENEKAADEFEKHNNIQQVNQQAMGDVKNEKNAASGAIASATAAQPNAAAQPVRPVGKIATPNHGKAPSTPNVAKAMPSKRGATSVESPIKEQTSSLDNQMKAHGVTDTMLANSNEASFTSALSEKNKAKTQSAAATQQFRNAEERELSKTQKDAQNQANHHIGGMYSARKGGLDHVHSNKNQTATKDSEKRKEIADHINSIYNTSKGEVDTILNNLDKSVATQFDTASKTAKAAFENHIATNMTAYKRKRYGDAAKSYGALGAAGLWLWDKATGLPEEVNEFFVSGKELYINTMNRFINGIAEHVTTQLNAAKAKIAAGKKAVQSYVNSLAPSLRKLGKAALDEIQTKFNDLEESVNSKKDALIDVLAKKYAENVASIDARIDALKAENSGFINKAIGALSGVFAFIIEIKNTLTNLLASVIDVVQAIIADPIGFLKNLIAGVGQGFTNFGTNLLKHLQTGFIGWLTGAMKGISFTMPEDVFSLKGIFSITMQVLGLGWDGIRAIGATVIGEPVMKVLETGFELVQVIRKDGIAGLWNYLKDQFADLKETVMNTIMDMIQTQVMQAGIKWIMGLLSPVGAFIKAAIAIIDAVKFFLQRAAQIGELVKAFTQSVSAVASGKVGAVAAAIENALGKAVPVLIGFLASLLGVSGLADKVMGVIRKIRDRIVKAITKFWNYIKEKGKSLLSKLGIGKKAGEEDKLPDGKDKLFAKLRNDDQKINVDGGHKLKFENEGELAVYSTRIGFNELLRQKQEQIHADKNASDYSKKQAALSKLNNDKKNFGQELSKYKSKQDKKYSANVKEEYKAMQLILKSMAESLEIIGINDIGTTSLLPTKVNHVMQGKKAKQVIAEPLTKIPGNTNGSAPGSSVPVGWEKIEPDDRSKYWVRAHLLNHHLHGPGVEWNLFPAHKDINKGMELAVENPAKKAIASNDNKMYFYETNLTYGAGDFPTHINVEFGEYDATTSKRKVASHKYDGPLQIPQIHTVNINTESAGRLQEVAKANGVTGMSTFFKDLVNERNKNGIFNDIAEIRTRLDPKNKEKIKELINLINDNKLNI